MVSNFLNDFLGDGGAVVWVLLPAFVANATATLPRGAGPPMDFGRIWPWDGRRVFGTSKTWSGFLVGGAIGTAVGVFEAYLILLAPPPWVLVPVLTPTVALAIPFAAMVAYGAMSGDAIGSFLKRRLDRPSGARTLFLDQFPFVLVPIALGLLFYTSLFVAVFGLWEAVIWLALLTLGLHALFNWIGYHAGLKKVPW